MMKYDYVSDEEFYQSEAWIEIKLEILERDGYECRVCDSVENLSVHHIVPRKYKHLVEFDIDSEENLLTLCWDHHEMADRKVDKYGRRLEYGPDRLT